MILTFMRKRKVYWETINLEKIVFSLASSWGYTLPRLSIHRWSPNHSLPVFSRVNGCTKHGLCSPASLVPRELSPAGRGTAGRTRAPAGWASQGTLCSWSLPVLRGGRSMAAIGPRQPQSWRQKQEPRETRALLSTHRGYGKAERLV